MTGGEHETEATSLEREAARCLADARALLGTIHEPGQRERYRERLQRAIELANRALAAADEEAARGAGPTAGSRLARAHSTLAHAHTARADDAHHGANQLSLSAQRAPTLDACDEGWNTVAEIVARAGAWAVDAANAAADLERIAPGSSVARAARKAAGRAEAAALASRQIVETRNNAYTFHTDSGFSFGEGWHVAAAALLAGVTIQIEPGTPGTPNAERFARDAGLIPYLQGYRPRPRAAKQTTGIVARVFRADPIAAQQKLRAAFLGDGQIPAPVAAWVDARFAGVSPGPKVLLWIRDGVHHAQRNTTAAELAQLATRARDAGLVPVVLGDAVRDGELPPGVVDLTRFSRDPVFQHESTRRAQLHLFEHLQRAHGIVGQLGVTTAGMDGPALMGMPTMYLTDAPNVRMGTWVGAVPGYLEIVREDGYLARIGGVLAAWARTRG